MTRKKQKRRGSAVKSEITEFVQDFIPVKEIRNGIIKTADGRYIKILEIEPINFMLRSSEEQFNIISSFASWLKISPMRIQFKSVTRKADSDKHIAALREELAAEDNPQCRELGGEYIKLIRDVGSHEALTRRFFLIFQYEPPPGRNKTDQNYAEIYGTIQTTVQNARAYFSQCGNNIVQPTDKRQGTLITASYILRYYQRAIFRHFGIQNRNFLICSEWSAAHSMNVKKRRPCFSASLYGGLRSRNSKTFLPGQAMMIKQQNIRAHQRYFE